MIPENVYECGEGWRPLVTELDSLLSAIAPGYEVVQVKQKFGTLRFYAIYTATEGAPVEYEKIFRLLINHFEALSSMVCEACGKPGQLKVSDHRYQTACEDHRNS